jgi:hypothetical protein
MNNFCSLHLIRAELLPMDAPNHGVYSHTWFDPHRSKSLCAEFQKQNAKSLG